jgi:hypothetical protein
MTDDIPTIPSATLFSETTEDNVVRSLTVTAAYDLRAHPRNYGIHHTEFFWRVQYGKIGVELRASPYWYLPGNREEKENSSPSADLSIHSPEPLYEGHEPHSNCAITGGDCYSTANFSEGKRIAEILISDPTAFWAELEKKLGETQVRVLAEKEARRNFS